MIEKLIEELIEALKANTEALKASSQPAPAPSNPEPLPERPTSVTTSEGSEMVTHDMAVITYTHLEQKFAQEALETVAAAIEPPKRRGRPPKSIVPTIPKVTPEPTAEAAGATEVITEVVPEVIPPKPAITLEQVRGMGQKLLDLTGDPSAIRTYVNERGCKALRELKPEQWAEAYEWLSGKVAALQP